MGAEMSCPCSTRHEFEREETTPQKMDIVKEVMRGKLLPEEVTYDYIYDQTKVALIKIEQLEAFFANRNLLKVANKNREINYYYNTVYISNFMTMDDCVFILLQYTPGLEDKSFQTTASSSFIQSKKGRATTFDYSANYMVELINLVSFEKKKVIEQILHDLNSKVKKHFVFMGLVNDSMRNFKILYKKSLKKESLGYFYEIATYQGQLDENSIISILSDNQYKYKSLKAIMIDHAEVLIYEKKTYYFIFEENISDINTENDYLVITMERGNNPNEMYVQDIAKKLNDFQGQFRLSCIVSDDKNIFVILVAPAETPEETPML
jgi:hypothetical protein